MSRYSDEYGKLGPDERPMADLVTALFDDLAATVSDSSAPPFAELHDDAKYVWVHTILDAIERAAMLTAMAQSSASAEAS